MDDKVRGFRHRVGNLGFRLLRTGICVLETAKKTTNPIELKLHKNVIYRLTWSTQIRHRQHGTAQLAGVCC